jgi:hypothetical protein
MLEPSKEFESAFDIMEKLLETALHTTAIRNMKL